MIMMVEIVVQVKQLGEQVVVVKLVRIVSMTLLIMVVNVVILHGKSMV